MTDESKEHKVTFHKGKKSFYKFTDSKKLSCDFEAYLLQTMKTFGFPITSRSKILYQKGSTAIWDIHLPNPGIQGKNAFRMLCVFNKSEKKVVLAYLFPRELLPYKGSGRKKYGEKWDVCIAELKQVYF